MTPHSEATSSCTVMRVLKYCAVSTSVVNVSVVVACLVTGQWLFGSTVCQVFGFASHVAVGGTVWLIALACLERYYKLLMPTEHQGVFSEINFKIIAFGVFFLVAVILANPLYGWGEFSELRGYFHLTLQLATSSKDSTVTPSNESNYFHSNNCFLNTSYPLWSSLPASIMHVVNNMTDDFREIWQFQSRVVRMSGSGVTFALRAYNQIGFGDFLSAFDEGTVLQRMAQTVACDAKVNAGCVCTAFIMRKDEVVQYKEIHLVFQELKVCSVDFTTVNQANIYFILMFIFSTAVAPYLTVFALCALTCCRIDMIAYGFSKEDWLVTRRTFLGCLLSVCFYASYFVVSAMNAGGLYVSPHCHAVAVVLYYCCGLVPCVFCLQVSCLRYPSSVVDTRSVYHENADIELLQLNRV